MNNRFLAFDSDSYEYESFATMEEASKWLIDYIQEDDEISPDHENSSGIWELKKVIKLPITDKAKYYACPFDPEKTCTYDCTKADTCGAQEKWCHDSDMICGVILEDVK